MKEYHIETRQDFNKKGKPSEPYYQIYYIKKFLGVIPYRKYITKTEGSVSGSCKVRINFKKVQSAIDFINKINVQ